MRTRAAVSMSRAFTVVAALVVLLLLAGVAAAQGYDEMQYVGLYHLNAYTYAAPTWFPKQIKK
jgi:hypothetical protein